MAHRVFWALATIALLTGTALADDATKASNYQDHAKTMALPSGFKASSGFKAIDAVKSAKLTSESAATAMVVRDSASPRINTH